MVTLQSIRNRFSPRITQVDEPVPDDLEGKEEEDMAKKKKKSVDVCPNCSGSEFQDVRNGTQVVEGQKQCVNCSYTITEE